MEIFQELAYILFITTIISIIVRFLKQPLIVGYIISGIIVGPYALNILHSVEYMESLSKIGIATLLFIVGLSLNPETIKVTGKTSIVTGIGQIFFTSLIGYIIFKLLGFNSVESLYGSIALTFSSTIIVLKLLSDRGDLGKLYGKLSIGFLLVQDIVASLLLIFIPLIGSYFMTGSLNSYEMVSLMIRGIIVVLLLYFFSKYILFKLSDYIAKSQELLFLFSISWGMVLAGIFYSIGFSVEIGALIAGVTLSASPYAFEISSRIRPLRDFFLVLFFIVLGSHIILDDLASVIMPAIVLSLFVIIGNPIIVYLLMNLLGYRRRVSYMCGLTVAQISEFSLVLLALGLSLGHVDVKLASLVALVGIFTISASSYMIIYADNIYDRTKWLMRLFEFRKIKSKHISDDISNVEYMIFGFDDAGKIFADLLKNNNKKYIIVDYNPSYINAEHAHKSNFIYGDAEDVEFLEEINFIKAKFVISTIPDQNVNLHLIKYYRKHNFDGQLIVTSPNLADAKILYDEGASYVLVPKSLGAHAASELIEKFNNDQLIFEREKWRQLSVME